MANFQLTVVSFLALLLIVESNTDAADATTGKRRLKILLNNPVLGYSHMQFQGKLADLLVEAGHEVHVLMFEQNPLLGHYNGTHKAQKVIRVARSPETKDDMLKMPIMKNPFGGTSNMFRDGMMDEFFGFFEGSCKEMVKLQQPLIRELAKEKYDIGITEAYDPCMFGIFHVLGIKTTMSTFAIQMTSWAGAPFGVPSTPSFMINYFAPTISGVNMNFWERISNFYNYIYEDIYVKDELYQRLQPVFNSVYGPKFPSLKFLHKNSSLCFVNGNEFFELPKPISNKIIYIGGIASDIFEKPSPKKVTLSPEVESIFDNTKDGVVLFSFGTITDTKVMTKEMKMAFLRAFTRFPTYDFVWKIERSANDSEIFSNAPNVHTFDWLNQRAILAQPKLKAFITHCGLNSMNEAASEGVPVVGIPLFGDQLFNAATLPHKKMGVYVDILDLHSENYGSKTMIDALEKVLHQPEYSHNAKLVQKKLRNMPFKPKEKFVKWVEFAAEFPDLNELNLPTSDDMSLFVYYSLDVISFSIIVLIGLLVLTVHLSRTLFRLLGKCEHLFVTNVSKVKKVE